MESVQPIKSDSQIKKMMKILDDQNPRDALMFRLGLNTILRISDILRLKVKDVIYVDGSFREYLSLFEAKTKNKSSRTRKKIKLNSMIRDQIKNYIKLFNLEQDDYLIFSMRDPDRPLDRVQAWRILKKVAEIVGVKNFGTHSMRKTLAWRVYKQSKDLSLVMHLLNHKSPEHTLRYIGIVQESVDNVYEDFAIV